MPDRSETAAPVGPSTRAARPPCPGCGGEGGAGDERCQIVICGVCNGTGVSPGGLPPEPERPEGQWGFGEVDPANPTEREKRERDGLDVLSPILHTYAREGIGSVPDADLNNRFKWYGLYTQRPPGYGTGSDGEQPPFEFFMMRIRVPGGALTAGQVRTVAEISREIGRDVCDITDRQNFQLHWIRLEDVPEIWGRLGASGLTTAQACGDVARNILGCPLAGIAADEILDATPHLLAVDRRVTGSKEFSNLPRKFKMSISGCREQCGAHEIMDVGLAGVAHPDGRRGFDLWVGGGLSTTPRFADRLGAFVPPERVVEVCAGITGLFRDWGYRRSRNRARLKFLVRDWGPVRFREVLEDRYLRDRLEDGPAPPASASAHRDHVGVTRQHDGRLALGFAPVAGRISGTQLLRVAELAERYGSGRIRTTTQQKALILDVPEERAGELEGELDGIGLPVRPGGVRAGTMACTGIEFCKLAVVETKHRAAWLIEELERRLPGVTDRVRINLNGCPNSCARYQIADIGLMGSLVRDGGERREAFQVHLGGHLGRAHRLGRKHRGLRVPSERLPDFITHLVGTWLRSREEHEDFSAWVNGLPEEELGALIEGAPR